MDHILGEWVTLDAERQMKRSSLSLKYPRVQVGRTKKDSKGQGKE